MKMYRLSYRYPQGFDALKVFSEKTIGLLRTGSRYSNDFLKNGSLPPVENGLIMNFTVINENGENHSVLSLKEHGTLWQCDTGYINPKYMIISDKVWKYADPSYLLFSSETDATKMIPPSLIKDDWCTIYLPPFLKEEK